MRARKASVPLAAYQGVGVFAVGQEQKACAAAVLQARQGGFQGAPGGVATGGVAIETEQYARYDAEQALEVFFAGGGAERGDGIAQALLG